MQTISQGTVLKCVESCKFGRVQAKKDDLFLVTNTQHDQSKRQGFLIDRVKKARIGVGYLLSFEDISNFFCISGLFVSNKEKFNNADIVIKNDQSRFN